MAEDRIARLPKMRKRSVGLSLRSVDYDVSGIAYENHMKVRTMPS